MDRLKDKVAIITGGSQGIGLATAKLFASEGCEVIIGDVNKEKGLQVEKENEHIKFISLNVTNEEDWKNIFKETLSLYGHVDIVANIAGITHNDNCENITIEDWNKVIAIDLTGVMLGTKYGTINMSGKGGSIINFSSDAGLVGCPENLAYCAAKGGVITLTKSAALHNCNVKNNVRVNAVCPGVTNTPLITEDSDGGLDLWASFEPIGRVAKPEEIAQAVLFLASDDSSYCTGSSLVVDGGYSAQ